MAGLRGDRAFAFPFDVQALIDEVARHYGANPKVDKLLHEILEPMLVDRDRAIEDAVSGVMARPAAPGFDAIVDPDLGAEIPHLRLFKTVRSALAHLKGAGWPTNKTVRIGMRGRWDSSEVTETGNISDTPAGVTVVGLGRAVRWNLGSSLIQSGSWTIENLNVFVSSATDSAIFSSSVPQVVVIDSLIDAPASLTATRVLNSTALIAQNSVLSCVRFTGSSIILVDTHLEFDQRTSGTITLGTSGTGPSSTTYLIMRGGSIGQVSTPANPINVLSRLAVFDGFYTVARLAAPGGLVKLNAASAQTQRMYVRPAVSAFSVFGSGVEVTATNSNAVVFVDGAGIIDAPGLANGYVKTWDSTNDAAVWTDPDGAFAPAAHASTHLPSGDDPLATGTPTNITPGDTAAEGDDEAFARADHVHGAPAFGTGSGEFAEGDHTHALDDLSDVDLTGTSDQDVVTFDAGSGLWIAQALPASVVDHGALSGLGDDDHTQYPLLAGRSGGQTLIGGTGSTDNLTLRATSHSDKKGFIDFDNHLGIRIWPSGRTFPNNPADAFVDFDGTLVLDTGVSFWDGVIKFGPTVVQRTNASIFGLSLGLFANRAIIKNDPAVAAQLGAAPTVTSMVTYQADAQSLSGLTVYSFLEQSTFDAINGGSLSVTAWNQYAARHVGAVAAGVTITTRRGFYVEDLSALSGTLTNNVGIDIVRLALGTNKIGIRNASTTVYTPFAQAITAAATTLDSLETILAITANASYTLSNTPTIANGQNGQVLTIVNVDTADSITLQDENVLAGSNLRLGAPTRTLNPGESITLAYSTTVGDWVETNFSGDVNDVQVFTSSGTWQKPRGATRTRVYVWGPGGGGGSGRRSGAGVLSGGGGAGGSGGFSVLEMQTSALGSTETVTVGTGGTGASGIGTANTDGGNGNNGSGASSFGNWLRAGAGSGGGGGTSAAGGVGGSPGTGLYDGWPGGDGDNGATGAGDGSGNDTLARTGSGGGGGAVTTGNTGTNGGDGSDTGRWLPGGGVAAHGTPGAAGYSQPAGVGELGGQGGGGGDGANTRVGGTGGAGGFPGGGGGGGGGSRNGGGISGAGGNGGDGLVVVVSW